MHSPQELSITLSQEPVPVDAHPRLQAHQQTKTTAGHWVVDPVVQRILDRMSDPMVRRALDRLVDELSGRHSSVYEMLQRLDRNGDGLLSREEMRTGLLGMGVPLAAPELDSLMRVFDTNMSGRIDFREFYSVITRHRSSSGWDIDSVLPSELPFDLPSLDAERT